MSITVFPVTPSFAATSRRRSGFTDFTEEEMQRLPPVPQVLVRTIPQNGRKSLYGEQEGIAVTA